MLESVEEARAALVSAIEVKGADYRYKDEYEVCLYAIRDGHVDVRAIAEGREEFDSAPVTGPGCIVGWAAQLTGGKEALSKLALQEFSSASIALSKVSDKPLYESYGERPLGWRALDAAQGAQDGGYTWGEALAKFDDYVADDAAVQQIVEGMATNA